MKLLKLFLDTYKEEYQINLKEGLIKTTPVGQSVSILKKKFPMWNFEYVNNEIKITLIKLRNEEYLTDYNNLLSLINNLGYFISFMTITKKEEYPISDKFNKNLVKKFIQDHDVQVIELSCEPKFDQKVNKIPEFLYHVTPLQNWEKIKKIGLVPKSRSKKSFHPERVYLGKDIDSTVLLSGQFYAVTDITEWCLLKIDTSLVPGDYLRLYYDPNYEDGYYTLNNIPPHAIDKLANIKIT